jgi:hypothetical protein
LAPVFQQQKGGDPMSNGLVRLLAAVMVLGSFSVAPAMADGTCLDMPVTASKEKPTTTAEAPKPEQPGS